MRRGVFVALQFVALALTAALALGVYASQQQQAAAVAEAARAGEFRGFYRGVYVLCGAVYGDEYWCNTVASEGARLGVHADPSYSAGYAPVSEGDE